MTLLRIPLVMAGNELQRLLPRHYKIMDLVLEGMGPAEIADSLDMSRVGIGLIINSPIFQERVAARRVKIEQGHDDLVAVSVSRAMDRLQGSADDAAKVHTDLLESENDSIKQRSASEILDRVGLGKQEQRGNDGIHVTINAEVAQVLQIALEESKPEVVKELPK